MLIYCVKCREKTDTINKVASKSKNGKHIIKGICVVCEKRKQQFVKASEAESVDNKE